MADEEIQEDDLYLDGPFERDPYEAMDYMASAYQFLESFDVMTLKGEKLKASIRRGKWKALEIFFINLDKAYQECVEQNTQSPQADPEK
jgi:hypothetical protein